MKAIVQDTYGSADVLELRDVDRPEIGADEVLVGVRAAGVDRGAWHVMTGLPYAVRLAFGLRAPRTPVPGMEVAGVVEAVGDAVSRLQPGDEVFGVGAGTFAEYARAPAAKLAVVPAGLGPAQAAVVPISGLTALQALRDHADVQPGQRVLVVGASGGVGTHAVQIAAALGAQVTGVASTGKTDLVASLGADEVIDYTRRDFAAGARRWDVILDIGGSSPLSRLRRALTPGGTLVIVGGEGGGRWLGPVRRVVRARLLSPFVGQTLATPVADENHADLEVLAGLVEDGQITPVLDRTYPLADAAAAMQYLEDGRVRGKVAVTV